MSQGLSALLCNSEDGTNLSTGCYIVKSHTEQFPFLY